MKILYIYGLGGSSIGQTGQTLKRLLPQHDVRVIDYNQSDCAIARQQLMDYIQKEGIQLLVGSSLGAFIALSIPGLPKAIINPCMMPSVELPKILVPRAMVATYKPFEEMVNHPAPDNKDLVMGFFAENDELLHSRYHETFRQNYGPIHLLRLCHHRATPEMLEHEFLPAIQPMLRG